MGFFQRFLSSNDKPAAPNPEPTPEPLPKFPYELRRVRGAEAVAQCLAWREEWRGSFTPIKKAAKEYLRRWHAANPEKLREATVSRPARQKE